MSTGDPLGRPRLVRQPNLFVERDRKGLYRQALSGTLPHFTGISDPYEPPTTPSLILDTDRESSDRSTRRILELLDAMALLPKTTGHHHSTSFENPRGRQVRHHPGVGGRE
jgi:hypothetical protein